jgi:hypothetical protein
MRNDKPLNENAICLIRSKREKVSNVMSLSDFHFSNNPGESNCTSAGIERRLGVN